MSSSSSQSDQGRIDTFRHPRHSVFQSLVEDVVDRMADGPEASQLDVSLAGVRASRTSSSRSGKGRARRGRGGLAHDLAHRIATYLDRGKAVPEEVPDDLRKAHGGVVDTLWTCARLGAEVLAAKVVGDDEKAAAKADELKFSTCDPLWASALAEYWQFFGLDGDEKEIPYIRHRDLDDFVLETLPADAKVALLGDWGTGTDDAIGTLEQIAGHEPDVLIHLGDIYYSGTEKETHEYFLDILNRVLRRGGRAVPVYTLTGNHDMYSGGTGYYSLLPELNPQPTYRPEQAQPASYFCLRTVDGAWQFLGMDTGLHDHDPLTVSSNVTFLEPSEEAWHVDKVGRFTAAGGRTILLSHHQLFSAFELIGGKKLEKPAGQEAANTKLLASFRKMQQAAAEASGGASATPDPIAAWFWGHEHNLDVYEPYLGLAKGRCMGHGAIPAFVEDDPYAVQRTLPDPPRLVEDPARPGEGLKLAAMDQVYAHGFVIVELDDATRTATASYYQETDYTQPMYVETL